ncbi:cytokinesis regulator [Xylaria sp. FL1042]|nr:cytokinesis regulator [Xylaria sp. FL1042]
MEPLRLKPRKPVEDIVENWDDDDFMIGEDEDLTFRSHSTSTTTRNTSTSRRRDSRSSFRSDRESLPGDERQVHLPGDDEKSTLDAIAAATHAGIPIPTNVPPSALMGGTIKRLGGRKIKKIFQEDWGDELELPAPGQALRLKAQDGNKFPEVLRQVSGSSPAKKPLPTLTQISPSQIQPPLRSLGAPINLEKFRDTDDDDDIFGDGAATIKASKPSVRGRPISLITPPTPSPPKRRNKETEEDNFENDLELPSDGKLKLSSRRDIPKTPSLNINDDFDWGEGSLGTRFGGTRRDAFSNRSSSVSAMSPSIASSFTAESEDEFFDGLVLPMGPLDLGERLKRRKPSRSPERPDLKKAQQHNKRPPSPKTTSPVQYSPKRASPKAPSPRLSLTNRAIPVHKDEEDLVSGLDFGEGNIFRYAKPTVHRNVRVKEARPTSPARPKAAVSITFTNKPVNTSSSRIPRPMVGHERSHTQSSLEPVSESGGPIPQKPSRRPQSRLSGHSAHSSISSIHTPTTPSSVQSNFPPTPRRRELCQKASTGALRTEPTTTSAQLLRLKRSLPAMRHNQSPAKPVTSRSDRPPSRGESRTDLYRPQSSLRPKTPVERARPAYESSAAQARKSQVPFLPAGASLSQSHNVNARGSRSFRRHDSDQGPEVRPLSRALSRNAIRSPSPRRCKNEKSTPEPAWQQINKPRRVRHFGDGHELDAFDDLPTSAQTESRFIKQPVGSGNKSNIRNKIYQNVLPDRNTPSPVSPYSPARLDSQPRFARDTAASRIARETSLAQRAQPTGPLAPLTSQRVAQLSTRTNLNPHVSLNHSRSKKPRKPPQLKPHLISNLSSVKDSKVVNGMTYNPVTFRWEGNENVLNAFEVPASSPSATSLPQPIPRDRDTGTPRPVLITNINTKKEIRRMGDMVFDPQNMCWLEIKTGTPNGPQSDDPMAGFAALEEEDPFKDIPDLEDKVSTNSGPGRVSDIREDWLVGEEFDVGPEFVRRQHEEEARWRRKCEKWTDKVIRDRTDWRWAIRDIVMQTP